jgi:membrane-associated phospholipid phosphatase
MRRILFSLLMAISTTAMAGEDASRLQTVKKAVVLELKRYGHDAKDLATQPLRWDQHQWTRFAEGTAAVAAFYAADRHLYDQVQRHRTPFTNDFAKAITPFGGQRALDISALMIIGGVWSGNANLRDAGRDSLESEFWAGGIVTPLLKRTFGRARPSQGQGARSFGPFSAGHESFPSGHATNAFAFATGIASHYDNWIVPTVVYSIATGVAFSRVHDRAHFPSDVVAGALIGRAVARGVVARHAGKKSTWQIVPILDQRTAGVAFRISRSR